MIEYQNWLPAVATSAATGIATIATVAVTAMQNKERFDGIDRRMDRMQTELTQRIDKVQSDLNMFHREMGRHDYRLDALEAKDK